MNIIQNSTKVFELRLTYYVVLEVVQCLNVGINSYSVQVESLFLINDGNVYNRIHKRTVWKTPMDKYKKSWGVFARTLTFIWR